MGLGSFGILARRGMMRAEGGWVSNLTERSQICVTGFGMFWLQGMGWFGGGCAAGYAGGGGCGSPGAEATGPRYFYREGMDDVIPEADGFVEHDLRRDEDAVLQGVAAGRGLARG
jgi:hypothetical protein